jgi:uncharacterized membrane protein
MIDDLIFGLTLLCVLGSGLIAGVFFAFSAFVMTALGRLPAPQGIAAMQSINVAVINPWFLGVFLGTAALSVVLAALSVVTWGEPGAISRLIGGFLYLAGVLVVTRRFNIPLNNALAAVEPAGAEGAELWARYLREWVAWNHARTVASLGATYSFILALH